MSANFSGDSQELRDLETRISKLPIEELDRNFAELCNDVDFLEAQVNCDLGSFSPKDLHDANERISGLKKQRNLMKIELEKRQKSSG